MSTDTTDNTATLTSTIETPTSTTESPKPRFIVAFKGVKRVFLEWQDVADYDVIISLFINDSVLTKYRLYWLH